MIGRLVGLCLLLGVAHGRCLPRIHGPADPTLRRARIASMLSALDAARRGTNDHQTSALDWDMQADAIPGSIISAGGWRVRGSFTAPQCRATPEIDAPPDAEGAVERDGWSAGFGDPSTPLMLRLTRLEQADRLGSRARPVDRVTHLWMGEARVLRLAHLAVARIDDPHTAQSWYGRLTIPRVHATGALMTRDGAVEFVEAGIDRWPITRAWFEVDARLGWLRDEAVAIATVAIQRPIAGGHLVPRVEAVGEAGDAARIRTASARLIGTLDTTFRLGACPWLCYAVVGVEGVAGLQVSDAAFIGGITGARWARGADLDGALVLGLRPVSIRLGGFVATNRFDTLARLPDAVDRRLQGWRADLRIRL